MRSNILSLLALAAIGEGMRMEGAPEYNPARKIKPRPKGSLSPAQEKKKAKARKKRKQNKTSRKK